MSIPFILLLPLLAFAAVNSQVPPEATFTVVNSGELIANVAEYGATYRHAAFRLSTFPFTLCFYNTTPGAYILAVGAGDADSIRWVWDANRRRPVGEKATLTLRRDGNLVLAESDGTIAWQTNTGGKNVAGIKLLRNGNLVLHDKRGNFIWQSFDHPVDTLLSGTSLKLNSKGLTSRKSNSDGSDGPYSLALEESGIIVYLNHSGELIRYADFSGYSGDKVTFITRAANSSRLAYNLILKYEGAPPGTSVGRLNRELKSVNYNAKYSYLRLSIDGNINIWSYVPSPKSKSSGWEQSFTYFGDYSNRECALPSKCGQFGLCVNNTCVSCPTAKGLVNWTPECSAPRVGRCGGKVDYFKVERAEHFLSLLQSAEAGMTLSGCRDKCSRDCKCKGFVYEEEDSLCLFVPLLATLIRDSPQYTVYVKYAK